MERTHAFPSAVEDVLSLLFACLRWAVAVPVFLACTVFFGTLAILGAPLPWRRRIAAFCERNWARGTLWAARCPVIVEREPGADLPSGGFVYASNHQGILDILALF